MNKVCLFGITGQDASYLADYYLGKKCKVIGLKRRSSTDNEWRLKKAKKNQMFSVEECDITDPTGVNNVFAEHQPDICINTAAQSHVATSFRNPKSTFEANTIGCLNILEATKNISPLTRVVQCSTSEMFGKNYITDKNGAKVQNENTQFMPRSPYAVSKCSAHELCAIYRDAYNLFVSTAISFNHGGPRRGDNFIEMKIGKWIKKHRHVLKESGLSFSSTQFHTVNATYNKLRLGNLDAYRDFTDARDIVKGLAKIADHSVPDDFVLCSGYSIQIRDLVEIMFGMVGIKDWEKFVYIDPEFFRPAEVDYLRGDNSKAKEHLGWKPIISLDQMCWDIINEG